MQAEPGTGRRERKRLETRDALRTHAEVLFRTHGYEATTVAQIVDAADVSEPTFFRHFRSKSEVALAPMIDGIDAAIDAVIGRPAHELPLTACRAIAKIAESAGLVPTADVIADIEVIRGSTELSTGLLRVFDVASERLAEDFARRLGVPVGDPLARQTAAAVMGTVMSVFRCWMDDPSGVDRSTLLREGFDRLADGLR